MKPLSTHPAPPLLQQRITMLKEFAPVDCRLTPAYARIAFVIFDRMAKLNAETVEISHTAIAAVAHVAPSTIKQACTQLSRYGYLTVRARRGRASLYSLPKARPEARAAA